MKAYGSLFIIWQLFYTCTVLLWLTILYLMLLQPQNPSHWPPRRLYVGPVTHIAHGCPICQSNHMRFHQRGLSYPSEKTVISNEHILSNRSFTLIILSTWKRKINGKKGLEQLRRECLKITEDFCHATLLVVACVSQLILHTSNNIYDQPFWSFVCKTFSDQNMGMTYISEVCY